MEERSPEKRRKSLSEVASIILEDMDRKERMSKNESLKEQERMILDEMDAKRDIKEMDDEARGQRNSEVSDAGINKYKHRVNREKTLDRREMLADRELKQQEMLRVAIAKHAPDAPPEAIERAKQRAVVDMEKQRAGKPGTLQAEKEELAASPDNAKGIIDSKDNPVDREKSLGAMISLLLPIIAGAAISGKTGAARGFAGAAEQDLAQRKLDDERRYEEKIYDERRPHKVEDAVKIAAARREPQKTDKEKLAFEKEKLKQAEGVKRESDLRKQVDDGGKLVNQAKGVLEEFKAVAGDQNWLEYQFKSLFDFTETSEKAAQLKSIIFDIVKQKQGSRPSDYDVKQLMKIGMGGITANGETVVQRMENVIKSYERDIEYTQRLLDGSVSDEERIAYEASKKPDPMMERIRGALADNKSPSKVKGLLQQAYKRKDISEEDLQIYTAYVDAMGGL